MLRRKRENGNATGYLNEKKKSRNKSDDRGKKKMSKGNYR
jgi:hypothetical protein